MLFSMILQCIKVKEELDLISKVVQGKPHPKILSHFFHEMIIVLVLSYGSHLVGQVYLNWA